MFHHKRQGPGQRTTADQGPFRNHQQPDSTETPVSRLLSRLEGVRQFGPGKWTARCPGHDDRSPSLGVRETDDGKVLVKCWAGCDVESIVAAVGLNLSDLFPSRIHGCDFDPTAPRRPPPRFSAGALLELVTREALVIAAAIGQLRKGEPLNETDAERVARAVETILAARREVLSGL